VCVFRTSGLLFHKDYGHDCVRAVCPFDPLSSQIVHKSHQRRLQKVTFASGFKFSYFRCNIYSVKTVTF
jgi:hypothetical protein